MEAVSFAWLRGFKSASILTGFHCQQASNFHDLAPRSDHDRATIGSRSGFDRGLRSSPISIGSCRGDSALEGVRSRLDREVLPQHLYTVRFLLILIKVQQPSDGYLSPFDLMPIGRSSGCHVARGKSSDPRHLSFLF